MNEFINYLERMIEGCVSIGGMQREKAVYQSILKEYRKQCNLQNVMASVSDTLLAKASEYEDEANADFDTEGVQHNLNLGRCDGLMQAVQEINKHLP